MNEAFSQYWAKTKQYWNQFNKTQKIMILSIAVLTLLTIVLLTYHFSKTEYSIAFTELDAADAGAIQNYLETSGIPFQFSQDGRTIAVPSTEVTNVKIAVESEGIVKNGSIGYGIFRDNMSSFGMTENQFNVLSDDAKAGEIQQLINGITGVSSSKVFLALPSDSAFINTETPEQASASVVIRTKAGYTIDQKKIDTMYNLVAKSIPGLDLANIVISDENGELLPSSKANGGLEGASTLATQHFQIKKQFELDIQKNVQALLGTLFSRDKVVVSVFSSINFDQVNQQQEIFEPVVDQSGIERSIQEIQKSYTNTTPEEGGVAGVGDSEVPNYPSTNGNSNSSSEELQRTINYEINQITKQVVSSPYSVKDLTINVGIEPPNLEDPESLTEDTKQAVKQILKNIVAATLADNGIELTDEELESKVFVLARNFQGKQTLPEETNSNLLLYGIGAAALAIGAAAGFFIFRRRRPAAAEEEEIGLPVKSEFPTIDFDSVENDNSVRKQLETLAKKKPEEFVNLLRSWLVEE